MTGVLTVTEEAPARVTMPIRFRCAYCNQLMGIARRKAGTVVRCPTCAGQVVVPNADAEEEPEGTARQPAPAEPPLFERSDFDQVFDVPKQPAPRPAAAPPPAPQAPAGAWGTHAEPEFDVERVNAPAYAQAVAGGQAAGAGRASRTAKR